MRTAEPTGLESELLVRAEEGKWKLRPEWVDSMGDSTEGKGSRPVSGGGGVRALCRGEAAKEWKWEDAAVGNGGREARLMEGGDCGICGASSVTLEYSQPVQDSQ